MLYNLKFKIRRHFIHYWREIDFLHFKWNGENLLLYSTSGLFKKWLNDTCNCLCIYISHLNMVLFIFDFEYKQLSSWLPGHVLSIVATTNEIYSSIELCSAKVHLGVRVNYEVYQYIPVGSQIVVQTQME